MTFTKPKSWFAFLLGIALGLVVFLPLAVVGLALEHIPVFLTGMAGIGATFIVAAFMGLKLATGIAEGRYEHVQPARWGEQIW